MTELHYRDGGTWRKAKELHYRDGGTWRKLKEAWYRDGGTWRKVFSAGGPVSLFDGSVEYDHSGGTAVASVTFNTDGSVTDSGVSDRIVGMDAGARWHDPIEAFVGNGYWIRADGGAWQQLVVDRTWSISRGSPGTSSSAHFFEIAASDGGAVLASGTVSLDVNRS